MKDNWGNSFPNDLYPTIQDTDQVKEDAFLIRTFNAFAQKLTQQGEKIWYKDGKLHTVNEQNESKFIMELILPARTFENPPAKHTPITYKPESDALTCIFEDWRLRQIPEQKYIDYKETDTWCYILNPK